MLTIKFCKLRLLQLTDWTQLPAVDLTQEEKNAWAVYRQSLRDIDKSSSFFNAPWPVPPSKTNDIEEFKLQIKSDEAITLNIY